MASLNARANQLARNLIRRGIGPEQIVAIALPRSAVMVVAILAVLKSGAAYLPLDPDYPPERLAFMIEDARPAVILVIRDVAERLTRQASLMLLDSAALSDELSGIESTNPNNSERIQPLEPLHPAYVIYTSGSTGAPKGVLIPHQNVIRLFGSTDPWFGFGPQDVWTLFHSYAFDFSVWELWGPLLHGGRLVVVPHSVSRSPVELLHLLVQEGVTVLNQTPSSFYQLIQSDRERPDLGQELRLRLVIFGGEALDPASLGEWYERHPGSPSLVNMYGITETTVHVTHLALSPDLCSARAGRPIGRCIPDLQAYVVDPYLQPVPVGIAGELYIGGSGLARGYLNRPDLTAERFVANPFGSPGSRLYRSGDRVRWLPEGTLDYLGRTDEQVKIRGFRIELGEIEACLARHPEVAHAAVIARQDLPGHPQLVAYVVPHHPAVDLAALRQTLAEQLPHYMVPAAIVAVPVLPLTPNGKLDRKALPAPQFTAAAHRAPRTPQEQILAQLFAEVLGLQRVGIDDRFFDLGGHSLLATRLVSRIRSVLDVELPVRALFEAPTVAELAAQLDCSSAARTALRPQPRPQVIPLSFAQQRLWFLHQFEGPSPTYNIPIALRLDGPLDQVALQAALADLIGRHESLRTVFTQAEGVGRQTILEAAVIRPELECFDCTEGTDFTHRTDCTEGTESAAMAAATPLSEALQQASGYCFDLSRQIPLRAWLLRLAQTQHVLVLLVHHIASDGGSMRPLLRDLATAYAARCSAQSPAWSPLPVQYADYTLWQRQWLGEESDAHSPIGTQIAYWSQALAGLPEQISLPADRPRPTHASYRGDSIQLPVDAATHTQLLTLAREARASLFMVLHGALAVLLSRLGAGSDIPLGSPIAARTDDALDDLVGFFVNTLVLRTDTSGNPSFRQLLARVRAFDLAAYSHQDLPFERLVEILNPVRSTAHHPLFQVMLALQNTADESLGLHGLTVAPQPFGFKIAKFDLSFGFTEQRTAAGTPGGLTAEIEYACDLVARATVDSRAQRMVRRLEAIAAQPDLPIGSIDLLSAQERRQILSDWNDTAHAMADTTLPLLFEQQVQRTPDALALVCQERSLSYRELNARANQLAHYLIAHHIGPEDRVAIALPRSIEMVVSILAVLKAGAAYLPLDPDYPPQRLRFMIEDARPRSIIATTAIAARWQADTPLLCLDRSDVSTALARYDSSDVTNTQRRHPLTSLHPAYVIYTSGSTGTPKAVVVPHRGIPDLAASQLQQFVITSQSRVLQFSSFSFDAAMMELLMAFASGACLVLPGGGTAVGDDLAKVLNDHKITHALIPPAALATLESIEPGILGTLIVGGDTCSSTLVDRWSCGRRMLNAYGPTESTVCTSISRPLSVGCKPPIGSPIWNTQVYVLDTYLQPVPVGIAGELYIGGGGLARGYLNRPDLTAERFVANPFGSPGSRLYRSGDRVRWLPEGTLDYLGRTDEQVKIRGFRIELGEIEACLARHPEVAHAAVLARQDLPGHSQLVAYVVPHHPAVDLAALRQTLAEQLPHYMVPAAIVAVPVLPLTPNGKLDRKALPAPQFTAAASRAPRTPQEQILAQLFAEVLGLQRVGIDDRFFDLGGHSLLATRLVSRIRSVLDVELPVRALFEAPTVAELAAQLDCSSAARTALRPQPRPQVIPLSFAQQRLWFLHQFEGPSPTYNIPIALRLDGPLDPAALQAALADLIGRHESLRTVFTQAEGVGRQTILEAAVIRPQLECLDCTECTDRTDCTESAAMAAATTLSEALEQASGYCFDLSRQIPLRAWLLRLAQTQHVLVLLVHHIASDGGSMRPLLRDLATAYAARCSGRAPDWKPLPVQYADYTLWQRQWLGEESDAHSPIATQIAYWSQALAGLPEQISLPADRPRPTHASYRGDSLQLPVDAATHTQLLSLAREARASLFMVLHGALAVLLSRLGAGSDIPLGSPIAARTDDALDDLVGFFVNTLVLRTDTSGNPSFRQLLARVRAFDLAAYSHQDLPFERLVEILNPVRSTAHHPLFQVMLALQNTPDESLGLHGLTVAPQPFGFKIAKFDLSFGFTEQHTAAGTPGGLTAEIEYACDLFERATVESLAQRMVRLLQTLAAQPDLPIGSIDLLSAHERRQILSDWNDTAHAVADTTLPLLFEQQVQRTPDALALVGQERSLSYRELNARANQLAHLLVKCGVLPETRVAIRQERTPELIISILAVLKAGGAYVPLHNDQPGSRLRYIMEQSGARLLLTDQPLSRFVWAADVQTLVVSNPIATESEATTPPAITHQPQSIAYVMYTSGSTGTPKGVAASHANVVALAMDRHFRDASQQRVLFHSPHAFDAATYEIWVPLLSGRQIVIAPAGELDARATERPARESPAEAIERILSEEKVTSLFLTAALFRLLAEERPACFSGVRTLWSGGEVASAAAFQRVLDHCPETAVANVYGPTETTTFSTIHVIRRSERVGVNVSIGKPMDNTQVYVLDACLQPVPVGIAGELYIGGSGLARGYLNRPDLTAERFVANPFGSPGSRLYRSGDRVRWLPEGTLDYLGRTDAQVKIRGFRIELGEIEACLARHPEVAHAAVLARQDLPGHSQLVAYVVPHHPAVDLAA